MSLMTKAIHAFLMLGLAISGIGCGDRAERTEPLDDNGRVNGTLVSDSIGTLRAELIQADRDFARRVREGRLESWVDAFAEDGMVLPKDGPIAAGGEAIRELFAPLFSQPGFDITWSPAGSNVASSGDLGYTFGTWKTSIEEPSGSVQEAEGKNVTIWRREADGRWRVQLDMGNTQPTSSRVD